MKSYTFRLAHLEKPYLNVGEIVHRGDIVGSMGSTGQSTGPHGHIDVVRGWHGWVYRLQDMHFGNPLPDYKELHYFIDSELTGDKPFKITTYVYDYRYVIDGEWKPHPGYDIVIDSSEPYFYWNRSFDGTVIAASYDEGYGNYIQIHYEVG